MRRALKSSTPDGRMGTGADMVPVPFFIKLGVSWCSHQPIRTYLYTVPDGVGPFLSPKGCCALKCREPGLGGRAHKITVACLPSMYKNRPPGCQGVGVTGR